MRIIVFDNDWFSPTYRQSIAQYVYQLEPQLAIRNRILAAGGTATASDPRQGRNIGLSAIVALNDYQFLVLERDNRGIGVDNPAGRGSGVAPFPPLGIVGSKRVFKILAGNDNDYSVTQTGAGEQFDVYVDFHGNFARCVLDDPSACEVNPPAADLTIDNPVALPHGYWLLPGVLHAYCASASDLAGYEKPEHWLKSLLDFLFRSSE